MRYSKQQLSRKNENSAIKKNHKSFSMLTWTDCNQSNLSEHEKELVIRVRMTLKRYGKAFDELAKITF